MTGLWWTQRLSETYANQAHRIAVAVAKRVMQVAQGELSWNHVQIRPGVWDDLPVKGNGCERLTINTEFDYHPNPLLRDALLEVIPDITESQMRFHTWPRKHRLMVDLRYWRLLPRPGYGQSAPDIRIPSVS